jgi:cyclase
MLHQEQLYNSVQFQNYRYIGDPLIAMKLFNEKEAQEICIVDIDVSKYGTEINYDLLQDIAGECFMPLSYGGGVNSLQSIQKILYSGFEKIILNTALKTNLDLLVDSSQEFGSSTIVACIDFYETDEGCFVENKDSKIKKDVLSYAKRLEDSGAGELLLNNISRDGTKTGLSTELISEVSDSVSIPIIASGGVGNLNDLSFGLKAGANAVAASSLFVYKGNLDAVLINYPDKSVINQIRSQNG